MCQSSALALILAAVCANVAIVSSVIQIKEGGSIAPTYLEIDQWMGDTMFSFDHVREGFSVNIPREKVASPDWHDFLSIDSIRCSNQDFELLKRVVDRSDCNKLRLGERYANVAPPYQIQEVILKVASEHARSCPSVYESEIIPLYRSISDGELIDFLRALNDEARLACDPSGKLKKNDGDLQPWRVTGQTFYECVKSSPEVFVKAIKSLNNRQMFSKVFLKAGENLSATEAQEAVSKHLDQCDVFVSLHEYEDLFKRVTFDLETYNHPYSETFNDIWTSYQICREFLSRDNADVIARLIASPKVGGLGAKQSGFSKFITSCKNHVQNCMHQ